MEPTVSYRFGHYRLLPDRRLLLAGDTPVKLGSRAFDMLLVLVERRERTVGKHELMELVWPRLVVEENNLQVHVVALRKLLGHPAISTVPGRGYRFTLPVAVEGDEPRAAAAVPASAPAGNLTGAATALFGRDDDLRTLHEMLDEHAVVTVAGAGGIGKTRLAQGVASDRLARQPDGVWWVELAPLSDPALVPGAVARALGLPLENTPDALPAVLAALHGRSALIVLDNAEHLLDGVAAFIGALRQSASSVRLLVTSQEVLRAWDEQVFRPGPLALPAGDDLAAAQASGAVALFVARAHAADPRFVLAANHFQRKGLWILHTAAILTQIMRERYGEGDPPVRWLVTASFPKLRVLGAALPSPGNWMLPRVAHALHCWPVAFQGADPAFTARSLRRLLREARDFTRPIGLFPEGVTGTSDRLSPALPGVGRLLGHLGRPVVPVGIGEKGRFVVRFGTPVMPDELRASSDPGALVMDRIARLIA